MNKFISGADVFGSIQIILKHTLTSAFEGIKPNQ